MSTAGPDVDREAWAELFGLAPQTTEDEAPARRGLFARLRENLTTPRQTISPQLAGIFAPKLLTPATWEELEDALITADVGVEATLDLVEELRGEAEQGRIASGADLSRALWEAVAARMATEPARIPLTGSPTVILIVGVNGSGKTTTVGKLAHRLGGARPEGGDRRGRHLPRGGHRPARGSGPSAPARTSCASRRAPTPARSPSTPWPRAGRAAPTWS